MLAIDEAQPVTAKVLSVAVASDRRLMELLRLSMRARLALDPQPLRTPYPLSAVQARHQIP
jgi:hypothetical protein